VEEAYFGTDGKPCPNKDGVARLTTKYDERGKSEKTTYYDVNGKAIDARKIGAPLPRAPLPKD